MAGRMALIPTLTRTGPGPAASQGLPGPRSLLSEVPVYVHVGLLHVADKGRG